MSGAALGSRWQPVGAYGVAGGAKQARKQEAAIAALLSERSQADAAQKAGVAESTLQRWLLEPEFQSAYRQARRAVVECAVGRLQQAAGQAVDALTRNLTAEKPDVQVRAALGLLEHVWKGLDSADLLAEVADLKRQVEELSRAKRDPAAGGGEAPGAGGDPPGGEPHAAAGAPAAGPGPADGGGGPAARRLAEGAATVAFSPNAPPLWAAGGQE
jgi:hypothetical protein